MSPSLDHYIDGTKVTEDAATKALDKAAKDGQPVHYDTVDTSPPNDQGRALNALQFLGSATPTELVAYLNQATDVYPDLADTDKAKAKDLLDGLKDDELATLSGSRYKATE